MSSSGWRCAGCGESFHSLGAFEKHRIGSFETRVGGKTSKGTRRCMTPGEMLAAGMTRNAKGKWGRAAMPEDDPRDRLKRPA